MLVYKLSRLAIFVGIVLGVFAPWILPNYYLYLVDLVLIAIILALGLNIVTGNSGQISLCHSSFMAIGAYAYTILSNDLHLPIPLCAIAGVVLASLGGLLVGFPARRLSGIYLALATLAFLSLVQILIEEYPDITGGIRGIKLEKTSLFGISIGNQILLFYLAASACALSVYVTHNIMRFPIGRAFDAIRTSPQAAQSLGIPVARIKLLAFTFSAAYAGLAGVLFAMVVGFIDPVEFGVGASLRYITFIVVGGLGSIAGSILGSIIFTLLPEVLRGIKEYSDLVYAVILLLSLLFMPKGLVSFYQRLRFIVQPTKLD